MCNFIRNHHTERKELLGVRNYGVGNILKEIVALRDLLRNDTIEVMQIRICTWR